MDLYNYKDSAGFELIPEGTIVEIMIGEVKVGLAKSGSGNTVLSYDAQVASGPYMYQKLKETITIKSNEPERDAQNIGRTLKRMFEYFNNASEDNRSGYILPEVTNGRGQLEPNWKTLTGHTIAVKVKVEEFISNKDGTTLHSNKIGEYASKNPTSSGFRIWLALQKGGQPWQKPLPVKKGSAPAYQTDPISGLPMAGHPAFDDIPM